MATGSPDYTVTAHRVKPASEGGTAGAPLGVATLDANGKVYSAQSQPRVDLWRFQGAVPHLDGARRFVTMNGATSVDSTAERAVSAKMRRAGRVVGFHIVSPYGSNFTANGQRSTCTLRKNSADTGLSGNIERGREVWNYLGGAAIVESTGAPVSFQAGDVLTFAIDPTGGFASSTNITLIIEVEIEYV
jgi:hypothetical protein